MRKRQRQKVSEGFRWFACSIIGGGALLTAGCATSPRPPAEVPVVVGLHDRIAELLDEPPYDGVHWGVLVVDAADGRTVFERNADLRFIPASNMKIPVAAAALGLLGPDFRWETAFYATGLPFEGSVDGHLYLHGSGDPTLGPPFHDSAESALEALADSLKAADLREIRGDFVLDASAWDSTSIPPTWMVEDLDPTYGATGGAFSVGNGELEVQISAGDSIGAPARLNWSPRGSEAFVVNEVLTLGSDQAIESNPTIDSDSSTASDPSIEFDLAYLPESRRWRARGGIPLGESHTISVAARDPVRLGMDALTRTLIEGGVTLDGVPRILWESNILVEDGCYSGMIPGCAVTLRVAGMASPPLSEVVAAILGPSQNWMSEQLVRTLGAVRGERGSWSEGFRVITDHLVHEAEVAPIDLHFRDGSGLSAYNLISPRALVRILTYARGEAWGESFRDAMAIPGRTESTLGDRLQGLEGRVFAKTGTISHVSALSGYVVTDDARELVFSILSNASNLPAARVLERIDAVVRELVTPEG